MLRIKIHERLNEELGPVAVGDQIWASEDSASSVTWEEAKALAEKIDGWRLPTKEELLHLVNSSEMSSITDNHDGWLNGRRYASYWSSTPYEGMNKTMAYGMTISHFNKRVHAFLATDNLRVRLIKE
jgi:formylglycine-generating enzyme required for sulfatase activity